MSYRLVLLTPIPVLRAGAALQTLDLWARDLAVQVEAVTDVVLLAPLVDTWPGGAVALQALPAGIRVVDPDQADEADLQALVASCDVVQVPGNLGWHASASARRLMRMARLAGKAAIVGITSDRARAELMDAAGAPPLQRVRAELKSLSIRISQRHLARQADGVFLVGEGLRRLIGKRQREVLVGTPGWIRQADIAPPRHEPLRGHRWRLCAAARLEPVKGIHMALEMLPALALQLPTVPLALDIAGAGSEEQSLRAQAAASGPDVDPPVRFVGTLSYPDAFQAFLREVDVVLLTNLNDEQPRRMFDAICQGCLPVCPDTYRSLGLPPQLLYRRGDVASLTRCLALLLTSSDRPALRVRLIEIANAATIETMHRVRRDWVRRQVLGP